MNIGLTGVSGRFGTVVTRLLLAEGHRVRGIDRAEPAQPLPDGVAFAQDDLSDRARLSALLCGCDALIHLAAIPQPRSDPPEVVFGNNVLTSYNALLAAVDCGIRKICLASSINAIGGAYSKDARYDYFPVDEQHPTYNEDAYSLSKWVMEAQADSIARAHPGLTISSLRIHGLGKRVERSGPDDPTIPADRRHAVRNHLWAYVDVQSAARATLLALHADFTGHEVFFIVAPRTIFGASTASADLAARHYPGTPVHKSLPGNAGFYDCSKADRLLGWRHEDSE
jgi:UDP-glucose 4-epimerase